MAKKSCIDSIRFVGILTIIVLLSGVSYSQKKINSQVSEIGTSEIKFTFLSADDEGFANIDVKATNLKTEKIYSVITNSEGTAHFKSLPKGRYLIKPERVSGYKPLAITVKLKEEIESNIKINLEIAGPEVEVTFDIEIPFHFAVYQEDLKSVQEAIDRGFDINTKNKDGITALHTAVERENFEIIKLLFYSGANISTRDKLGRTPLWMLIDAYIDDEETEVLNFLIANGADVNARNNKNETLLMAAAMEKDEDLARVLLKAGANPHLKDKDGKTALMKTKDDEIKDLLKQYGAVH